MKKTVLFLMLIIFCFSHINIFGENENFEILCGATLEDDFIDNEIIVVLDSGISRNYRKYDTSFFPEIKCLKVEDLTSSYDTPNEMNEKF